MASTNGRKKNKVEVQAYKRGVKSGAFILDSTVGMRNSNLAGSAEIHEEMSQDAFVQETKIPFGLRAKRFLKKHTFEAILSVVVSVVVAVGGWYAKTLIDLKIECAVCENRLSAIEEDIGKLNTDQITREILNLQLDALRQELNSASALQTTELKNRIDLLERQIELLQE